MSLLDTLRTNLARIITPTKNSMGVDLARDFYRYGNRGKMAPGWTEAIINDKDLYTGYGYAAIRNRANAVARVAIECIQTKSNLEDKEIVHPYLKVIDESRTFTNYKFWYDISTFLDLEGVYYLLAVRNVAEGRVGSVQEFKLLNPYDVVRVIDPQTGKVAGYVENKRGLQRDIPPEMIIEMRELNPFDDIEPFAMTDAAKDSQFTIKTANDYTRHSLKHNVNAPGIISTDVILPDPEFQNFVARINSHTKGEPIFGNGSGSVKFENMQVDIEKAALEKINAISRDTLLSVSGMSKTSMGIEESGTTRETAKVQLQLAMEGQTLPRIQLIIDALNQDFKNMSPEEFKKQGFMIVVDNPLRTDYEADNVEQDVLKKQSELYVSLISQGFDAELAAEYVKGEIAIDELGEPDPVQPVVQPDTTDQMQKDMPNEQMTENHVHTIHNEFTDDQKGIIEQQQSSLKNAIMNIEQEITAIAIDRIGNKVKNQFEESDVITKTDKKEKVNELELVLTAFYGIVLPLYGTMVLNRRFKETKLSATYSLNSTSRSYIKKITKLVANSHVDTVVDDILETIRQAALKGLSQQELINEVKKEYNDVISETRATTIARTETNRAFTRAQFEADKQFIAQNSLEGKVFKQWVTRSSNPCPYCTSLAQEPPIPFDNAFRDLGDEIEVTTDDNGVTTVRKLPVNFEALEAGNAHPNCSCVYQLIIE